MAQATVLCILRVGIIERLSETGTGMTFRAMGSAHYSRGCNVMLLTGSEG